MADKYLSFSDREIGFFELCERIALKIDLTPLDNLTVETVDAWGKVYAEHKVDGEEIVLGDYPVGWYRIFLKNGNGERIEHEYIAFTVTVPESLRYKGETCFATDIAGEYEPSTMKRADEIIRATKLQGFELTRGRSDAIKWSDRVLEYRRKVRDGGLKTMAVAMNHYREIPKIASIDLRDIYTMFKDAQGLNDVVSDIVELVNEPDLHYAEPALPDSLTAYCKAAFLGIADSEASPNAAMPALALGRDGIYSDIMLQNGMLDYSPIYNFHGYDQLLPLATYARRVSLAYAPEDETKVSFMSENGKKVWCGEDDVVYDEHLMLMSRYAVTASTDVLSQGVDKWFWFISRAFLESGGGFGSYHAWTYQPYPVTAALSNLTYQLGRGEYVGKLACAPEKCKAHMFDDGMGRNIAVISSAKECFVKLYAAKVTLIDLFGAERVICGDEKGEILIKSSQDPVFVRFDGYADEKNYYKTAFKVKKLEKLEFSKGKRVVLNALWKDQNLNQALIMQKGYLAAGGKDEHVTLRIYNFNKETVRGRVFVESEYSDHFDIRIENPDFEVEAFGEARVEIVLKAHEGYMNSSGDIKFGAIVDGVGEISPAVCRYWFKAVNMPVADEDIVRFKDFIYPENWDLTNIAAPGYIEAETDEEEQSITMRHYHGGGYAQWYFPVYKVLNPEIFEGTDGIIFRKKNSYETQGSNKVTVFVLTKDGRSFWSGHSSAAQTSTDWMTVTYPWETFGLYGSPEGLNDIRPFVTSDIVKIRVGVSGTSAGEMPDVTYKDLGVYYDRFGATMPHPYSIIFENVNDGQRIDSPEGFVVEAVLPKVKLDDIRVFDGKERFSYWRLDGDRVKIDISSLGRGEHTLQVSAKTTTDYRYIGFVTLYIA